MAFKTSHADINDCAASVCLHLQSQTKQLFENIIRGKKTNFYDPKTVPSLQMESRVRIAPPLDEVGESGEKREDVEEIRRDLI